MELAVFLVSGAICLAGAIGVVAFRNPVHNALSLVSTLFGIAVLFIAQEAEFLAAVQVIVYAGAVVVLFLFVIMLLGVDRAEELEADALPGQRPLALGVGAGLGLITLILVLAGGSAMTGVASAARSPKSGRPQVEDVADLLFTDYVFAMEITAALLTIAVVGAVMLTLRRPGEADDLVDLEEPVAEWFSDDADDGDDAATDADDETSVEA